jgi:hypothetical protein
MTDKIEVKYLSNYNVERLKELYNKFIEQYKIRLTEGGLIVKERRDEDGINIYPGEGKIYRVFSLKPFSELEIMLKENMRDDFLLFETKDSKFILVNYTNKDL